MRAWLPFFIGLLFSTASGLFVPAELAAQQTVADRAGWSVLQLTPEEALTSGIDQLGVTSATLAPEAPLTPGIVFAEGKRPFLLFPLIGVAVGAVAGYAGCAFSAYCNLPQLFIGSGAALGAFLGIMIHLSFPPGGWNASTAPL